jgi:hypothetical protein
VLLHQGLLDLTVEMAHESTVNLRTVRDQEE